MMVWVGLCPASGGGSVPSSLSCGCTALVSASVVTFSLCYPTSLTGLGLGLGPPSGESTDPLWGFLHGRHPPCTAVTVLCVCDMRAASCLTSMCLPQRVIRGQLLAASAVKEWGCSLAGHMRSAWPGGVAPVKSPWARQLPHMVQVHFCELPKKAGPWRQKADWWLLIGEQFLFQRWELENEHRSEDTKSALCPRGVGERLGCG